MRKWVGDAANATRRCALRRLACYGRRWQSSQRESTTTTPRPHTTHKTRHSALCAQPDTLRNHVLRDRTACLPTGQPACQRPELKSTEMVCCETEHPDYQTLRITRHPAYHMLLLSCAFRFVLQLKPSQPWTESSSNSPRGSVTQQVWAATRVITKSVTRRWPGNFEHHGCICVREQRHDGSATRIGRSRDRTIRQTFRSPRATCDRRSGCVP